MFLYPQRFSAGQSEHLEEGVKKCCAACGPKEWTMADWRRWMGLLQVRASIQPADIVIIWASWMGLINILMVGRRNIVNKIIYWAPFAFFRRSLTLLVRNGPFGEEWTTWRQGRLPVFFFQLCCTSALGGNKRHEFQSSHCRVVCKVLVVFCGGGNKWINYGRLGFSCRKRKDVITPFSLKVTSNKSPLLL